MANNNGDIFGDYEFENWEDYFNHLSKDWRKFTAEICGDMKEYLYDYDSLTARFAESTDNPEIMDLAVNAGRMRMLAIVSEKSIHSIGHCLDAAAALFSKNKSGTAENTVFRIGDHVCIKKGIKSIHAIYVGSRKIVYFPSSHVPQSRVKIIPFNDFAQGGRVVIISKDEDICTDYTPSEIAERALSRIGDNDFRNSESFVQWCRCGS
ncbi:MAG: lecithin retinol acyltransferase family protein [Oscillospiraceae bacterium]|nr:lecithin retinol acyltransferase family protein [Oscillospiraceae bacterium]